MDEAAGADGEEDRLKPSQHADMQQEVVRACSLHLLPQFFCVALLCNLDRANLAFAATQLSRDLGFSKPVYGLGSGARPAAALDARACTGHTPSPLRGAGVFFIGYAFFQVPGTVLCARVGAPRFLGVSLVAWGAVASSFATLRSARQFYALRFVLGLAESAAYPGAALAAAGPRACGWRWRQGWAPAGRQSRSWTSCCSCWRLRPP